MKTWRWIDTGVRRAAENMALNRALLEARQAGEAPSTLRFLGFTPSALVGRHGDPARELDLAYCREQGIALQRRITGGGAIYMDQNVLGWELYLDKAEAGAPEMAAISKRICGAAARAVSALGVQAEFRPPTDIVVGGRKISGTGGAIDGSALVYQGTLLIDFDVARMLRALGVADEKMHAGARAAIVNLRQLVPALPSPAALRGAFIGAFGAEFGAEVEMGELNAAERARYEAALAEMDSADWIGSCEPATSS
ncbi:MAG TPA: lipoate--protein ligase family protein [Burkholderiales bacterium]|nr:lipoate--protein ligase family protein [Burkholderiales bacterium]